MGFDAIEAVPLNETTTTKVVVDVVKTPANDVPEVAAQAEAESAQNSDAKTASSGQKSFSLDDAVSFIANPPDLSNMEPAPDASEGAQAHAGNTTTKKGVFSNLFSKAPHTPEQVEAKIGADLDGIAPKMGFQLSDAIIPALIASCKDEENGDKYKASEEGKESLVEAYRLWFIQYKVRITPEFNLLWQHGIVYGIPLLGGLTAYIQRVQLYGWHFPWSKSWKKKAQKMQAEMPGTRGPISQPTTAAPSPPPAAPPQPQPVPMQVVREQTPPLPAQQPPAPLKKCLYSGNMFETGAGFPKTGKNPDLIDAFYDMPAYIGYKNANKMMGPGARTEKDGK